MEACEHRMRLLDEVSAFLATSPTQEQLISFRLSGVLEDRVRELLAKLKEDHLTEDEEKELNEFEHVERLMGLVKARVHAHKAQRN